MPYMLPALGITGVGAAYATALGSGVGTLIQGGNIGDALKSAAIAGVSAGVFKGAQSKMGGGTFGEGFTGAFKAPVPTPVSDLVQTTAEIDAVNTATASGSTDAATSGAGFSFAPAATAASLDLGSTALADGTIGIPTAANPALNAGSALSQGVNTGSLDVQAAMGNTYATPLPTDSIIQDAMGTSYVKPELAAGGVDAATSAGTIADATRGSANTFLGNLGEAGKDLISGEFGGFGTNLKEAFLPNFQVNAAIEASAKKGLEWATLTDAAKQPFLQEAAAAGTSMLTKVAGYAPLALGAASAGGFFEVPEQEQVGIVDRDQFGNMITGSDLLEQDPYKYSLFAGTDPRGYLGGTTTGSNYNPYYTEVPAEEDPLYGANGGGVFPRRIGGIMPSEGIANEDSVKAMLMPGEFVMTTDAVKGLGNGNAEQGIKNMYTVMRDLERRGGAMA